MWMNTTWGRFSNYHVNALINTCIVKMQSSFSVQPYNNLNTNGGHIGYAIPFSHRVTSMI